MKKIVMILLVTLVVVMTSGVVGSNAANKESTSYWSKTSTAIFEDLHSTGAPISSITRNPDGSIIYVGITGVGVDSPRPTATRYFPIDDTWENILTDQDIIDSYDGFSDIIRASQSDQDNFLITTINNGGDAAILEYDAINNLFSVSDRFTPSPLIQDIYNIDRSDSGRECLYAGASSAPIVACASNSEADFINLDMTGPADQSTALSPEHWPEIVMVDDSPVITTQYDDEVQGSTTWLHDGEEWINITDGLTDAVILSTIEYDDGVAIVARQISTGDIALFALDPSGILNGIPVGDINFGEDNNFSGYVRAFSNFDSPFISAVDNEGVSHLFMWDPYVNNDWNLVNIPDFSYTGENTNDAATTVTYYNNGLYSVGTTQFSQDTFGYANAKTYLQQFDEPDVTTTTATTTPPTPTESSIDIWQNTVSGNQVGIKVVNEDECGITSRETIPESSDSKDEQYSYPQGLISFNATCNTEGATMTVELYFFNAGSADNFIPRKFLNNEYLTLEGAALEDVTINSQPAVKLTYSLVDGGKYDADGVVNAEIVDPAGIATLSGNLPATGAESKDIIFTALILMITGYAAFASVKRKNSSLL